MNRRDFLTASAVAGLAPLAAGAEAHGQQAAGREIYELRKYQLLPGAKQRAFNDYLQNAAIPAMNRLGPTPLGAFTVTFGDTAPSLYLLVPHPSLESVGTLRERMMADAEYRRVGAAVLDAPLSDPAFVRVESWILRAVGGMPKLVTPALAAGNQPRIFELRIYESPSDAKALRVLEEFDRGWVKIFPASGLSTVFFAETLAGQRMPSLQYMLAFRDMRERDAAWAAFSANPDWRTISTDPYFAETVQSSTSLILRPTAYSQI
jgi:hypothetical protein